MAKKYTSINFNHIYEKTGTNNNTNSNISNLSKNQSLSSSSSFSSPSYSAVSAPNKHGKILVLTRPTPKPVTPSIHSPSRSQSQQQPNQFQQISDRTRSEPGPNEISVTGTPNGSLIPAHVVNNAKDKEVPLIYPKPDKFVPPHLRPGYVPREECSGPKVVRPRRQESPVWEDGRPKSGGQERMRKGGASDLGILGRPGSSGSRPNSSE